MPAQVSILLLIDTNAAIETGSLNDHIYLIDNMSHGGSTGQGTGRLITAINGTYYADGSQADELVLNWLSFSISSAPPTLPKSYSNLRTNMLQRDLSQRLIASLQAGARAMSTMDTRVPVLKQTPQTDTGATAIAVLDKRGEMVSESADSSDVAQPAPFIIGIFGEAVEKGIIYPALYGSPDENTSGLYWAATVSSYSPGIYKYTLMVRLYRLLSDGALSHFDLPYTSYIQVGAYPRVNGFSGGTVAELRLE
jgi:hypothetical protein